MHAAAILGLGCTEKDLLPFQAGLPVEWSIGLPGATNEVDAILIFGGDGTIHRHLDALVKLGLPVLVVPRGSGNDFARALGLRRVRDSLAAWRSFVSGTEKIRPVDLGVITPLGSDAAGCVEPTNLGSDAAGGVATDNYFVRGGTKYFCCVGGVGLDAEVARRANLLPRWLRGRGGYALALPPTLARFAALPMKISAAGTRSQGDLTLRSSQPTVLAAFANTPNYGGGMQIAPNARMDDGLLDICLVTDVSRLKLLSLFPTVYFGKHLGIDHVESFQTTRLRIETEAPADVYADGEFVCRTPIEVSVAAQALRVVVQPSQTSF